jgi:hypothetical protein
MFSEVYAGMSVLFHGPYRLDTLVNGSASNEALYRVLSCLYPFHVHVYLPSIVTHPHGLVSQSHDLSRVQVP